MNWINLSSEAELASLLELSNNPEFIGVAIFKHSTRCSISTMAKSRIERNWKISDTKIPIYYLDLLQHRTISNLIESQLGVVHQSPQLIIVKSKNPIYQASHNDINVAEVEKLVTS